MGGNALLMAAGKLRDAIRTAAAVRWGCAAEDVAIDAGKVLGRRRPIAAAWRLRAARRRKPPMPATSAPTATARMPPMSRSIPGPARSSSSITSRSRMSDASSTRLTLHGQAVGAIVQGLGGAFLEHFVYDQDGQLLTGSFADYLLPTASDFPQHPRRRARRRSRHRPIRSAPRARAKAASFRSAASSPMRSRRRSARSASSRATCRCRRRGCGS